RRSLAQMVCHPLEIAGNHLDRDADQHKAEKIPMVVVEAAADVEGPLAVAFVAYRLADEVADPGIVAMDLEIVALGQVDRRHRIGTAEIDVVAIGGDDGGDLELRQAMDLFAQDLEHL